MNYTVAKVLGCSGNGPSNPLSEEERQLWADAYLIYICPLTPPKQKNTPMCNHPFRIGQGEDKRYVPCGTCYDCQKKRRSMWALRNIIEFRHSASAYFCTLTYDDEYLDGLDYDENLDLYMPIKPHYQKFLKRIRKHYDKLGISIRYFLTHEYGGKTYRPHYHIILYFSQEVNFKPSDLRKFWTYGFVQCDRLNQARIHYATKYINKHFRNTNLRYVRWLRTMIGQTWKDGKVYTYDDYQQALENYLIRSNSFNRMSTRPPIGYQFLEYPEIVRYIREQTEMLGHYPNFNLDGVSFPLPRLYINKIFTDEERQKYSMTFEEQFDELRESANKYDLTIAKFFEFADRHSELRLQQINKKFLATESEEV